MVARQEEQKRTAVVADEASVGPAKAQLEAQAAASKATEKPVQVVHVEAVAAQPTAAPASATDPTETSDQVLPPIQLQISRPIEPNKRGPRR